MIQFRPDTIPLSCKDISFLNYAEFRHYELAYIRSIQNEEYDAGEVIENLSMALSCVVKLSKEDILDNIPMYVDNKDVDLIGSYTISLGDELSITRLYAHIVTLIKSYTPKKQEKKSYSFDHECHTYTWNNELFTDSMFHSTRLPSGIAILVSDLQNIYNDKMNEDRFSSANANYDFSLGKRELSLLCTRLDDKIPFSNKDRELWIEGRSKEFDNVPLSIILDIRFFLTNILSSLDLTKDMKHSFMAGPIFTM